MEKIREEEENEACGSGEIRKFKARVEGIKLGNPNVAKCGAIVDLDIRILIYI